MVDAVYDCVEGERGGIDELLYMEDTNLEFFLISFLPFLTKLLVGELREKFEVINDKLTSYRVNFTKKKIELAKQKRKTLSLFEFVLHV